MSMSVILKTEYALAFSWAVKETSHLKSFVLPNAVAARSKERAGTRYSYVGRVSAQGQETGLLLLET